MIEASAPIRICDNGGWTDTWFGAPGRVFNIAATPGVDVSIRRGAGPHPVLLDVESFEDRYPVVPGAVRVARHRLLEAAIDALPPPAGIAVEIRVRSAVPPGSGTGTSAAVAVALLGGLSALRSEGLSPREAAYAAHRLEVDILGIESGIQDQLSVAFGGINYIEIDSYPHATVQPLPMWEELSSLLTLVYCGRSHDSSSVHRQVIDRASGGSGAFSRLRDAAVASRDAVVTRDLDALAKAMIANTEAQRSLHSELVGSEAELAIEMAAAQGAIGWKVNGAGGDGGSVTILSATRQAREAIEYRIAESGARQRVLPIRVSNLGLEVRGAI